MSRKEILALPGPRLMSINSMGEVSLTYPQAKKKGSDGQKCLHWIYVPWETTETGDPIPYKWKSDLEPGERMGYVPGLNKEEFELGEIVGNLICELTSAEIRFYYNEVENESLSKPSGLNMEVEFLHYVDDLVALRRINRFAQASGAYDIEEMIVSPREARVWYADPDRPMKVDDDHGRMERQVALWYHLAGPGRQEVIDRCIDDRKALEGAKNRLKAQLVAPRDDCLGGIFANYGMNVV